MSNGAEMCYLLACEGPNIFRAFAPVAGTIFPNGLTNNICSPGIPVPIFETHGRNDNITLIQGDPFDQFWGPYLSIDTIIDFWVDQNSLTNLIVDTFPNLNNNNKITISYKFSDPITNNEVWLYTHKSGHNWGDDGDIVIEQEIWDFFNQMSLSTSTSIQEHPIKNKLIKVVDILGRETEKVRNTLLFYIYDDGTVDKQIIFNK